MTSEFRDLTVRIPEDALEEFKNSLVGIPKAKIIRSESTSPSLQVEKWEGELLETREIVAQTRGAIADLSPEGIQGFARLWVDLKEYRAVQRIGINAEELVHDTLELFDESIAVCEAKGPYRYYGTGSKHQYYNSKCFLNPREIRLLVKRFGLNGQRMTNRQISETEQIASPLQSAMTAMRHLVWGLEDLKRRQENGFDFEKI